MLAAGGPRVKLRLLGFPQHFFERRRVAAIRIDAGLEAILFEHPPIAALAHGNAPLSALAFVVHVLDLRQPEIRAVFLLEFLQRRSRADRPSNPQVRDRLIARPLAFGCAQNWRVAFLQFRFDLGDRGHHGVFARKPAERRKRASDETQKLLNDLGRAQLPRLRGLAERSNEDVTRPGGGDFLQPAFARGADALWVLNLEGNPVGGGVICDSQLEDRRGAICAQQGVLGKYLRSLPSGVEIWEAAGKKYVAARIPTVEEGRPAGFVVAGNRSSPSLLFLASTPSNPKPVSITGQSRTCAH